ncbi:MAG: 4Fe-4S binding protein [Chloroflexota bacterium]
MDINSATLIYFSPTQTTKRVIEAISQGLQVANLECIDLTLPAAETRELLFIHRDLAVIGSPVYGGRLPTVAVSRLRRLKGNGAPAVIVAVYGNRAYEDALIELRDLALEIGFKPVAAGAFVGEHSYSTSFTPVAVGRPDVEDLEKAMAFGKMIRERMMTVRALDQIGLPQVPGTFPYKELRTLSDISPVTQDTLCTKCGLCISVCPTAAIDADDPTLIDKGLCIRCCACVKVCPAGAKTMDDPRIRKVVEQLSVTCSQRKEPETYL